MNLSRFFVVLCVFACALLVCPAVAEDSLSDHVITVVGYGQSVTSPDKVTVVVGVEAENTDAQKAQGEAASVMEKVVSALKSAGIAEKNIKTSQYSMYSYVVSEYDEGTYAKGTTVYRVTNSVQVTSYDVENIGKVIDKAAAAGANKIGSLQFGLSDEKQIQQRKAALHSAVKAARADADAVSEALGIKLAGTGAISVEQNYNAVSYVPMAVDAVMMAEKSSVAGAGTAISGGELSTTATVSIVYLY